MKELTLDFLYDEMHRAKLLGRVFTDLVVGHQELATIRSWATKPMKVEKIVFYLTVHEIDKDSYYEPFFLGFNPDYVARRRVVDEERDWLQIDKDTARLESLIEYKKEYYKKWTDQKFTN